MLVAAHPGDLRAARAAGLRTAFVARPLEYGQGREAHRTEPDEFDVASTDFVDLAEQLGA
jgi:2-haloacid dehalogenase